MPLSIRRRLLIRLISAIVASCVIALAFVYFAAYEEVEEVYDAALAQQSRVLATLMTHESEEELKIRRDLRQLVEEVGAFRALLQVLALAPLEGRRGRTNLPPTDRKIWCRR